MQLVFCLLIKYNKEKYFNYHIKFKSKLNKIWKYFINLEKIWIFAYYNINKRKLMIHIFIQMIFKIKLWILVFLDIKIFTINLSITLPHKDHNHQC